MLKYIALFIIIASTQMSAQSLDKYRWENRLIILVTTTVDNAQLQQQLQILQADVTGLEERKLEIIQLTPEQVRYGVSDNTTWKNRKGQLYEGFQSTDSTFEAILVGLDGGEKLRDQQPFTLERLFAVIDAMPMRRSELRRQ
jgi:hypothetical protein